MTTTLAPAAYMTALLAEATPYICGVVDAQKGELMRPALYDLDGDRAEYVQGYEEEAAAIIAYGKDGERRHE